MSKWDHYRTWVLLQQTIRLEFYHLQQEVKLRVENPTPKTFFPEIRHLQKLSFQSKSQDESTVKLSKFKSNLLYAHG